MRWTSYAEDDVPQRQFLPCRRKAGISGKWEEGNGGGRGWRGRRLQDRWRTILATPAPRESLGSPFPILKPVPATSRGAGEHQRQPSGGGEEECQDGDHGRACAAMTPMAASNSTGWHVWALVLVWHHLRRLHHSQRSFPRRTTTVNATTTDPHPLTL